ncbi:hypothetical protein PTSG_08381 [Salpingoeca rosetta]|uniref:serine C-palmitoyltransferase n=1 Tax=Salpingoeca rosetta (strain ATCC 50818 / BSB-021) TaxID=946362 RepID=F2UJI9_SALR5|nr:uncharacterized protein PTSG_08381 [Salpingoeca rosetta]EGD77288.1 hypothetical protein PTSG_08381 [Salpingoeca rosetta]|eukprot:XP_004990632.1 hypothetical protein PTSG_08381 [Salpingoeca rosetta]
MSSTERLHPLLEVFTVWDVPTFHLVIEGVLIALLVYVFSLKRYRPKQRNVKLTKQEEEELLREWKPEPLVEPVKEHLPDEGPVVEGVAGVTLTIGGEEKINMGTYNFLGLVGDKRAEKGLEASRSKVVFFKHNDMKDLKAKLEEQAVIDRKDRNKAMATRRFIVVEGIYANTGQICPLDELVKLKYQYKVRLVVEESMSFGVLGASGKGVTEHFNVKMEDVDMVCVSLGMSLGSIGGFCCGRSFVVDHQRLSGQGYCFSASLPPLLANAAISNLNVLDSGEGKDLLRSLRANIAHVQKRVQQIEEFEWSGAPGSAVVHVHISPAAAKRNSISTHNQEDHVLEDMCNKALAEGVAFVRANYIVTEEKFPRRPSIRLAVSAKHTQEHLDQALDVLARIAKTTLSN